jgi:HAD superfamily hydrolase (TIGR01509 family)
MLQALIFDFDGLIIDTEWTEFRTWQDMCQRYGVELSLETYLPCVGRGATTQVFHPYTYLVAQLGHELDRADIEAEVQRRNLELIDAQPLLPGVKELIVEARRRGLLLAVASSSPRSWVERHLRRLSLLNYFDALGCGDEVGHAKPYPDPYLKALEKLEVSASEAVAFEDSLNGMLAARAAGIFCVVVPGELTQYLEFGTVDLRVKSLLEISLDALLQRFAANVEDARRA